LAPSDEWLGRLAKLKVDKATGDPAPHKPLLLLVVLDLAEQGLLPPHELELTPELAFRFATSWSVVAGRRKQRPDVRYPFYYLKSDGFWVTLDKDRQPTADLRAARFARLPAGFVAFASDPVCREKARQLLIAKYFPAAEQADMYALTGLAVSGEGEPAATASYQLPDESQKQGREARFRLRVVAAYHYTCALTGYRLTTISGRSIVDAAHIHQFADSRNNDVRNGLALCKNAHWLFDNGLWTLGDDYRVLVAKGAFAEAGTESLQLAPYHGETIKLPENPDLWPDPLHLAWHRRERYLGA
jgi:putative restriction endonuclease